MMRALNRTAAVVGGFALVTSAIAGLQEAEVDVRQDGDWDASVHINRIQELYRLTDAFGDQIWPGFDTRKIPIAINVDNEHELLFAHPNPPAEFRPYVGADVDEETAAALLKDGAAIMMRDGCTRYGPRGGGWAVELGGEHTAYVGALQPGRKLEDYLTLLLHECFHVYQRRYQEGEAEGPYEDPPELDGVDSALLGLESRVLLAALDPRIDREHRVELARMFVAVRESRRARLSAAVIRTESREEYSEGTASYTELRFLQLLMEVEDFARPIVNPGEQYAWFNNARYRFNERVRRIVPFAPLRLTFSHAAYEHGMGICLLLDQLVPGWKDELKHPGVSQFDVLKQSFDVDDDDEREALLAAARTRFDFESIEKVQLELTERQRSKIEHLLDAGGRRFRLYHKGIPGSFKWRPRGPVHLVPGDLVPERITVSIDGSTRIDAGSCTIWEGGMEAFEKPGLSFTCTAPVLFGPFWLEWVQAEPVAELKDLTLEHERQGGDAFIDVRLFGPGFEVLADRARIVLDDELVVIEPMPRLPSR